MKERESRILLWTCSYETVKAGNTVSITGDGGNAWNYYGPSYKKLAPRLVTYTPYAEKYNHLLELRQEALRLQEYLDYRKQIEEEYIRSYYETRLKGLDIDELFKTLEEKFGQNIIFLCHESIEEFCHRRLVADYIELQTGIYIPEVAVSENGFVKKLNPIRYKNRLEKIMKL